MLSVLSFLVLVAASQARQFTFVNNYGATIWVGLQPNSGSPLLEGGGWSMGNGATVKKNIPNGWGGRFWARTGCGANNHCLTGDCGNKLKCNGAGGAPPTTLAEIRLNGDNNNDFYDISLVNGFNVGIEMSPEGKRGSGRSCTPARCTANVNQNCPASLRQQANGRTVACWASCDRTHSDDDCCTGSKNNPNTCQPSESARYFKSKCPDAYSYAYDDKTSTFTCQNVNYRIRFTSA